MLMKILVERDGDHADIEYDTVTRGLSITRYTYLLDEENADYFNVDIKRVLDNYKKGRDVLSLDDYADSSDMAVWSKTCTASGEVEYDCLHVGTESGIIGSFTEEDIKKIDEIMSHRFEAYRRGKTFES